MRKGSEGNCRASPSVKTGKERTCNEMVKASDLARSMPPLPDEEVRNTSDSKPSDEYNELPLNPGWPR